MHATAGMEAAPPNGRDDVKAPSSGSLRPAREEPGSAEFWIVTARREELHDSRPWDLVGNE
jgi:hypothetical protein